MKNPFYRKPDFYVGGKENPYMLRWWITPWSGWFRHKQFKELKFWQKAIRTLPNIYLHKFLKDDDDRALHDHPWKSMSIILKGGYWEHTPGGVKKNRRPGRIYFRKATAAHRIELYKGCLNILREGGFQSWERNSDFSQLLVNQPAWTIFVTGFKTREWGFHCPKGWRHWKDFVAENDHGDVGKGCD